ncbi:MAG: 50S ribosomal protein L15 [candidate division Zixibacteria bacterium]|jgi:large subunit ribosomal protein L15|nr:50S ribosomal protein L15 [candidate division Zixibacteria bacterium]
MDLHSLKPPTGATKDRKRVGRGAGSGLGETSGRGHKGQKARSGNRRRHASEGGQMPLHRRLPKYGFTNIFKKEYQIVNVADLARCDTGEVTIETLKQAGLVKKTDMPVKILGNGSLDKALTVKASAFSKSAVAKIEAAGGKAEVVA